MYRVGLLRCGIAAVLFGASVPAAKLIVGDLGPFTLAGLLYLGAALAVIPFVATKFPSRQAFRESGMLLAIAIAVGSGVAPVLYALGLDRTSSASVSLLLNLELVATTLIAGWIFREYIGIRVYSGALLVVSGAIVLGVTTNLQIGGIFIALACLGWAIDNCVTAVMHGFQPVHITVSKGVVAGSMNLGIGLLIGERVDLRGIAAALVIGALGYGASMTMWVSGARLVGAARGQVIFSTAPFVGIVIAWFSFSQPITAGQIAALALALAGVACIVGAQHAHEHVHDAVTHVHEHSHDDEHHEHAHDDAIVGRHSHEHTHDRTAHSHAHAADRFHRHRH
jgi:drug/metabolite transporter (DMT)-like permease